jgi:hypothetical protein
MTMPEPTSLLMRQFLAWVADRPRTYYEAMEAWRSNCPRLAVWEDALAEDLVRVHQGEVALTPRGKALLGLTQLPEGGGES